MEIRTLKKEEFDEWLDHCLYVFNKGEYSEGYRQYFKNHWMNDPWRDLESIFVAASEGRIVSTIRIFHRKIYINGQLINMGGIGEVSTRPEYQRMGLSTKLFSFALKRMQELGIKVSLLSAAQDKIGFYNKLGWQSVPRCFNVSSINEKDDFKFNIRPVNFDTDIDKISLIHRFYSKSYNGIVGRDNSGYWNNWVRTEAKNFYVVEDNNNKIIAYIDFDKYDKTIRVREYGELLTESSLFSSLITKLAAMCKFDECEVIYGAGIQSSFKVDRVIEENNDMIRLINPFILDNHVIENTEQLVKIFGNLTYWDIDSF